MEAKTRKSEMTQAAIIDAALDIAAERGLAAVSMKGVADRLQLSKSGVFSRSGSVDALQLAVVEEYGCRFVADIFLPALQKPRGLPRLDAIMHRWFERITNHGGIGAAVYEAAAFGLDPAEQRLRGILAEGVNGWRFIMRRTLTQAVDEKHLRADTDVDLLMYQLHSLVLGALYESGFLGEQKMAIKGVRAYARLIDSYRA